LENLKRRDHSEDLGVNGKTIMDIRETGWKAVDRMYLAQERDQWRALVYTVTNLRVS